MTELSSLLVDPSTLPVPKPQHTPEELAQLQAENEKDKQAVLLQEKLAQIAKLEQQIAEFERQAKTYEERVEKQTKENARLNEQLQACKPVTDDEVWAGAARLTRRSRSR